MTADIKLLPLPEYLYGREASDNERVVTIADAHSHALRNVAHATAPLQAEIERLRAVRDSFQRVGIAAQARAERLAEALRELLVFYGENVDADCRTKDWRELEAIRAARNALIDHEQEKNNE